MNNGKPLGSNGVGRTGLGLNNGVMGNESQTVMAVYAIIVTEEELTMLKRQAAVFLEGRSPKVPKYVHAAEPSNGTYLEEGRVEQGRPNFDSSKTGQCNQYSINNASGFKGYSNNGAVPNLVNNPCGDGLSYTKNFYSFAMNNRGYASGFSSSGYSSIRDNGLSQRSSRSEQLSTRENKNPNQLIEDSITLVNKWIEEKNWKLCYQEAKKGLAIPGVRDEQKDSLYNHLSFACNKLKDYEGAKQASEAGLGLLGARDKEKGKLYNNLGFACNGLKDYEGGKQASEAGLAISGGSDELKGQLYNNLCFACRGLKDYEGVKQACKAGLAILGIRDEWKRRFYSYLCFICNELKDYEGLKQACEARLMIPGDNDKEKKSLYTSLSFAYRALKDYKRVKQACEAGLAVPGGSDELQSYLYKNLCFACYKLGNDAEVLKNAEIGLTFSETNISTKIFFLALLVKCNSKNNPNEELQAIAKMLKAFMDINNDVMEEKKKAAKKLLEVISINEIKKKLNMMLETNVESEFEKSVLRQIEFLDKMAQRIGEIT